MNSITDVLTFTGPISPDARRRAEHLSRQQATPEKGERVRLNILSVSFVNSYLQCMGFETDLENSDSWNPVQQTLTDVADLSLKNLGALECRPILEGEKFVYIPEEAQLDRIGYVVVQISKSYREAKLLGFVKEVASDLLPVSQLQSLENLLEYLEVETVLIRSLHTPNKTLIKLKQWLENIFEAGWLSVETLLGTQANLPAWSLRSSNDTFVSRGKLIDFGTLTEQGVVLVVTLPEDNEQEMDIIVEIHPKSGQDYLPPNLQLMILDFEGLSVMEAQTRSSNKNIQLQFSGAVGERFSIKVALGDISVVEDFIIC
ncbi:hypothetical protein NIES4071_43460 [Calothrix sp. NIES-4071]|nr:hypothetical protein NIES4071_43460 [Calothrix sp. NIES-4071]BAZ58660.1 hypothetical protein NIES4105_43390 [Calothrix sp. NIES-4105]